MEQAVRSGEYPEILAAAERRLVAARSARGAPASGPDVGLSLTDLIDRTRRLLADLEKRGPSTLMVAVYVVELLDMANTIASLIMCPEDDGAHAVAVTPDLGGDLAYALFLVFGIGDHYRIDLEAAYRNLLGVTGWEPRSTPASDVEWWPFG